MNSFQWVEAKDFKPEASEHNEQATFFDYVMNSYLRVFPEIHPLLFSVPNGSTLAGNREQRARQMNKLKAEGFTPGVADVLYLAGYGGYFGLALEFKKVSEKPKRGGKGGVSEAQNEFITAARLQGYRAEVVYGADEGIAVFENYIAKPKTQELIYLALKALESDDPDHARSILNGVTLTW